MKRNILLLILILSAYAVGYAQQQHPGIDIAVVQLQKNDDCVAIDYAVTVRGSELSDCETIFLDFYLDKEGNRVPLKPLIVNGKSRNRTYKRSLALNKRQAKYADVTVLSAASTDTTVVYQDCIPYEEWMDGAVLHNKETVWGCGNKLSEQNFALQTLILPPPPVVVEEPVIVVEEPVAPAPEPCMKVGMAHFDYPVGGTTLDLSVGNNQQEWRKIVEEIRAVEQNEQTEIIRIEVIGYASPEGPYALNEKLSRERAGSVAKQIRLFGDFSLSPGLIHSSAVAEDWEGLVELLEEQPMPYQEEVLRIIERVGIFDGREAAIMKLNQGTVYRTLLREYFPKLRRTEYRITYLKK